MSSKAKPFGKYGLTGNTGFVWVGVHLSATYDSNGGVFVEDGEWWKRMSRLRARLTRRKIITCSKRGCKRPAVALDHFYPYYNDYTLCKEHAKKLK